MQVFGGGIRQRKAHHHPAHQQRCLHGHGHHLVGLLIDQQPLAELRAAIGLAGQLAQRLAQRVIAAADGPQLQVRPQPGCHRGANAAGLVGQRILDGGAVFGVDRRTKAIVGGQQGRALLQGLGTLRQQPLQHPLAHLQLIFQQRARIGLDAVADAQEAQALHHQHQGQEQAQDAARQSAVERAVFHEAGKSRVICSLPFTVTGLSSPCEPAGRLGCQARSW